MIDQSNTRLYRVGIVGTGGIAYAHGRACAELECAELCAICDVSEVALDRYGDEFGIANRYLDLNDMLVKENLDIIIICTWEAQYRPEGEAEFQTAAMGELPPPGDDQVSIQCYNGPADEEHWIRFESFCIKLLSS